jgi:hypothetical protein
MGGGDIFTSPPSPLSASREGENPAKIYVLRTEEGDEEVLRRLLALNRARGADGDAPVTPPDEDGDEADE